MSHVLARTLFHSAMRYQTRLAYRQQLLGRLVDIGADLFAMVAACSKAHAMVQLQPSEQSPVDFSVVSRHLSQLKRAGLVETEKQGREVYYSFRSDVLVKTLRSIADALENCCPAKIISKKD